MELLLGGDCCEVPLAELKVALQVLSLSLVPASHVCDLSVLALHLLFTLSAKLFRTVETAATFPGATPVASRRAAGAQFARSPLRALGRPTGTTTTGAGLTAVGLRADLGLGAGLGADLGLGAASAASAGGAGRPCEGDPSGGALAATRGLAALGGTRSAEGAPGSVPDLDIRTSFLSSRLRQLFLPIVSARNTG